MILKLKERLPSSNKSRWVWRYIDACKFLSLLQTRCLYFPSASNPAFKFALEGQYRSIDGDWWKRSPGDSLDPYINKYSSKSGHRNFLSCWYKAEMESYGMWQIYGKGSDSVAIQSDPWNYIHSKRPLIVDPRDYTIAAGPVEYVNIATRGRYNHFYRQPTDDELFWYKDVGHSYENEWRMLVSLSEEQYCALPSSDRAGLRVEVDLGRLIERVYLSPSTPNRFLRYWNDTLTDYGVDCEVRQSRFSNI